MTLLPKQRSISILAATLGAFAFAPTASAQAPANPGIVGTATSVDDRPCVLALPLPPTDPSTDTDYNCYYFGNYTWNDGSGAGNVSGRIYWPSICGDGTTNPPGELPLPTVILMHGDGHNYLDYNYLLRHLALNGIIAASIESTGTNQQRTAQALTYLNFMSNSWSKSAWVDRDNLGLIGHSRGGEAVLTLARNIDDLNLNYDVNAIISLAPTDNHEGGGIAESLVGSDSESFLVIYGTHDEDVTGYCTSGGLPECGAPLFDSRSSGFALYDRAGSEGETEPFPLYDEVVDKCLLYIEGANHNGWRSTCAGMPPIGQLSCSEHQELAKGYMNAFLRWKLRDQAIYKYYFSGGFPLPVTVAENIVVHRSYSRGYDRRVIDNFEQPGWGTNTIGGLVLKESTVTVIKDGSTWDYEPSSPHDTRSLTIRWSPPGLVPWMQFLIPNNATTFGGRYRDVTRYDYLSLRAGQVFNSAFNTPNTSKDFYVQLRDSSGGQSEWVRVSDYADLPYPKEVQVFKFQQPIMVVTSPMKTIRIPTCRFEGADLENVSSIWFYFSVSGSSQGEIFMDNIEFTD